MSYVHAHIPLDYVNNQQPDDATDVESTELFEFSEGMKLILELFSKQVLSLGMRFFPMVPFLSLPHC